jgi:hypothetical protein
VSRWGRFATWLGACTGIALAIDQFLIKDLIAEIDALIADVDARTGDQLAHLILGFTAERALQMGIEFGHRTPVTSIENFRTRPDGLSWVHSIESGRRSVSRP